MQILEEFELSRDHSETWIDKQNERIALLIVKFQSTFRTQYTFFNEHKGY